MESLKYSRLIEFFNAANEYLKMNSGDRSTVTFALNRLLTFYHKKIENVQKEWQEEVNDEREVIITKYCEKDKDTGIFKEKMYEEKYGEGKETVVKQISKKVFTAENERKADKEIFKMSREVEAKWMNHDMPIKIHIVPIPPAIEVKWYEVFKDFIFEPMGEDELLSHYLAQGKKEVPELLPE